MTAAADLNTAERLIRQALRDVGRLQVGQVPSGEVYDDALSRMYDIINTWQTQGIKLWLNVPHTIPLSAGVASYTLGPAGALLTLKPLRVLGGWYVTTAGARRPLTQLSVTDYYNLGSLVSAGAVNSFMVDKQVANLVVRFWSTPNASEASGGSVQLLLQRQAVSPDELSGTVELPIEWYMALRWALADDSSSGQPAIIMERAERKASFYRGLLEDWDVEDASTSFAPERSFGTARRF